MGTVRCKYREFEIFAAGNPGVDHLCISVCLYSEKKKEAEEQILRGV
jgi:hypothetical protein